MDMAIMNDEFRPARENLLESIRSFHFEKKQEKMNQMFPITNKVASKKPLFEKPTGEIINEYLYEKESFFTRISDKFTYISGKIKILPMRLMKTKSMKSTMEAFNRAKNVDLKAHQQHEVWIKEMINILKKIDQNCQNVDEEKIRKLMNLIEKYEKLIDYHLMEVESMEIKNLMNSIHFKLYIQLRKLQKVKVYHYKNKKVG